jgi:uncharacterized protein (DUF302 family)
MRRFVVAASLALTVLASPALAGPVAKSQGVYITLLSGLKSDVPATAAKVEGALKGAGFGILASYDNGVPEGCRARAHTIVFSQDAFAASVLAGGMDKAFGLPLRLAVYDGEAGVWVAMANPVSLLRTFNAASVKDETAQKVVDEVAAALASVGAVAQKPAGQIRDSGEIGGMGGGPFSEKVVPVLTVAKSPADTAAALKVGIGAAVGWHAVYSYKASDDVFVVGVANGKTEGRAFGIAGEKRATPSALFPGVDHAAAFPVEIVVAKKGANSSVSILKEMWRMKLYFQDAGNWAFMKNMQMPGDIQSEIEAAIRKALP